MAKEKNEECKCKHWIHTYLLGIVVLGLLAVAIIAAVRPGFEENKKDKETISVSGMAEREVMPNEVEIYLAVQTEGTNASLVQVQNTDKSNKVIEALVALGIAKEKIETTSYNLYPKQNYDEKTGESKIYGYTLYHTIRVTTSDVDHVGKYTDSAIANGANNIQNVNFKLTKESEKALRASLLSEAAADAKSKAESLAQGVGARIGKTVSVSESGSYYPMFNRAYGGVMMEKAMDSSYPASPTSIMPQKETVSTSVGVVYELENKRD